MEEIADLEEVENLGNTDVDVQKGSPVLSVSDPSPSLTPLTRPRVMSEEDRLQQLADLETIVGRDEQSEQK